MSAKSPRIVSDRAQTIWDRTLYKWSGTITFAGCLDGKLPLHVEGLNYDCFVPAHQVVAHEGAAYGAPGLCTATREMRPYYCPLTRQEKQV